MQYKIGKVRNYSAGVGDIITAEKKYLFLDTDVVEGKISNDDLVIFGDEDKNNRAFFVKKIEKKPITMTKYTKKDQ